MCLYQLQIQGSCRMNHRFDIQYIRDMYIHYIQRDCDLIQHTAFLLYSKFLELSISIECNIVKSIQLQ